MKGCKNEKGKNVRESGVWMTIRAQGMGLRSPH